MSDPFLDDRSRWNASRFRADDPRGFYESYFQRANHPQRPLAFWIRYTVFRPRGDPRGACGELWAIYFDGESNRITAATQSFPIDACVFSPARLDVCIGTATLTDNRLSGRAAAAPHAIAWTLDYAGEEPPLPMLPERFYAGTFPKAKVVAGMPGAMYFGALTVDGVAIAVDGWKGSQNHNWGSRHTDRYAWGQVAGFDNAPDAFFECYTAQIKLGALWSPRLTSMVLRVDGREYSLTSLWPAALATGRFDFFTWTFGRRNAQARICGRIQAPASAFVGLEYRNPPGEAKTCLNTKLASARVTLQRPGQEPLTLTTQHRAALEFLTDRDDHGVPIVA